MDKRKIEQIRQKYDLIIHINEDADIEFWYARDLMNLLKFYIGKCRKMIGGSNEYRNCR